jgi:hypothetical protein
MFKGLEKSKANIAALAGISCLLIGVALQPSVKAHGVETNFSGLEASGLLQLNSYFSTGEPLVNAEVRLQSPDGSKTLKLGRTGSDGSFKAKMPAQANRDWELVVDGGPGHRAYLELSRPLLGISALGSLALFGFIRHGKRQRRP